MRSEIEPPPGLTVGPAVHRQRDEVRAVLDVPKEHASLLTRATPSGGEPQGAPPASPRAPKTGPAAGDAVQAAMSVPRQPDKPPGRQSRPLLAFVRHGTPSLRAAPPRLAEPVAEAFGPERSWPRTSQEPGSARRIESAPLPH